VAYYNQIYSRALKIAQSFGGAWQFASVLEWIPEKLRNGCMTICQTGINGMAKKEACMVTYSLKLKSNFWIKDSSCLCLAVLASHISNLYFLCKV